MKKQIFSYLTKYSTRPNDVDKIIISAFLIKNKITVKKNTFLKTFIIKENASIESIILNQFISIIDKETSTFNFEELIELFEFVISPEDRIINGAIYTPLKIRDFITRQSFNSQRNFLYGSKIADIACGCGGFLFNAARELKIISGEKYSDIFRNNIFGLDIQSYSITRTKLLLTLLALKEGEDESDFHFNLFEGDALTFKWQAHINNFQGFNIILGNPPYVCARNLSEETKASLKNWSVCKSGNPDLYIPFFQIGIENLATDGILGFITMNSFFKSLNGRALREYFQAKALSFKIIDFGAEQVFKSKNTYTCICFVENNEREFIQYVKSKSEELSQNLVFNRIDYLALDFKKGWNLQDNEIISKIESTGIAFGNIYKTRHGIATLKNDIYIFSPAKEDQDYYYLQNGNLYPIEKGICKDIVNSNKLSRAATLNNLVEKIIFPYDNEEKPKLLKECFIMENYPNAYRYLNDKRKTLAERDKGNGEYENWFAFGRTQSLEKITNKMFFPKMSDKTPSFIINSNENLLFYNGLAIIGKTRREMKFIKKLMESRLFWYYITTTSKPYSSDYYSLNGNYIKNFGICNLSKNEKDYVLKENNRNKLDAFFESKYEIYFD